LALALTGNEMDKDFIQYIWTEAPLHRMMLPDNKECQ